jgi:hypothetical protein
MLKTKDKRQKYKVKSKKNPLSGGVWGGFIKKKSPGLFFPGGVLTNLVNEMPFCWHVFDDLSSSLTIIHRFRDKRL